MNQVPSPMCPHCGRNLSTDDLRGIKCPSCGTSLPHHARAAQQVALVNQVMAQHMAAIPSYGMHQHHVQAQVQQATRAAMSIGLIVAVIVGIVTLLVVIGAIVAVVLLRAP